MEWELILTEEEYQSCHIFADNSSKSQRENHSNDIDHKGLGKFYLDTKRGKVGEVISKKFLEQAPLNVQNIELDFSIYERSIGYEHDIKINNNTLSIKSSKHFSNWLLLESKYILRGDVSDFYIFVSIAKDFKSGKIRGFARKEEILESNKETLLLKQGEVIPNTTMHLDTDNHARHSRNLHNNEDEWIALITEINH